MKFYDHERTDAWIDGLENAFQFFAGVPQEILFDNAKTIMIERDAYQEGQHKWNPKLLDCAKKYSFYSMDIRKAIYTTNAIESLNSVIRHATKKRKIFPTDDSVKKVVYLAIMAASKKWTMPIQNWKAAMNRFSRSLS